MTGPLTSTVRSRCALLAVAAALGALPGPARAQVLDQFISPTVFGVGAEPGVTVLSRSRPEFDSAGLRFGNVVVRPLLNESVGYETNVLGTSRARGSAMVETNASVSAASDWSRNSLRAELTVDDVRFTDLPKQSFTNWSANVAGTYEIGRDVLAVQYQHLNLNQTTRDLDVPELDQPLTFNVDTVLASYRVNLNRVSITPGINVSNYTYSSGTAGGSAYRQEYRNRVVVTPTLALGYEFAPQRSAVLVIRDANASYTNRQPNQPRRDYNDVAVLAGIDYAVTGLFRVRLLGGYEARVFSSSAYKTLQSPVIEASAIWNPTGLTTVTGLVSRRIQDTADESTAGFTQTTLGLSVDHEYLRNILLRGTASVAIGEYDTGGSQTLYSAGASATYLANRYARFTASYGFLARQSSGSVTLGTFGQTFGSSFTDHRFLLQVRLSL